MSNELTPYLRWYTPDTKYGNFGRQLGLEGESYQRARSAGLSDQRIRELLAESGATAIGAGIAGRLGVGDGSRPLVQGDFFRAVTNFRVGASAPAPAPAPKVDYDAIYKEAFQNAQSQFNTTLGTYQQQLSDIQTNYGKSLNEWQSKYETAQSAASQYEKSLNDWQSKYKSIETQLGEYQKSLTDWQGKYETIQKDYTSEKARADALDEQRRIDQEISVSEQLRGLRSGQTVSGGGRGVDPLTSGKPALQSGGTDNQSGSVLGRYMEKIKASDSLIDEKPEAASPPAATAGQGPRPAVQSGYSSRYYARRFG